MTIRKINFSFIIILTMSSLFLGACGVNKSGVEIVSNPTAKVYLNGKESGTTVYKNNSLTPGEYEIKLVDSRGNFWERKVKLGDNVTSVINWTFGEDIDSGYIISMERTGENGSILVSSNPGGAMIYIDGELKNGSPAKIEGVSEGDKKLSINYPGYRSINLIVKMVKGYQILVDAKLEKETKSETVNQINPTPTTQQGPTIKIKETETGWLRVRNAASNGAEEIGKAKPGELYKIISEDNGWYQIIFEGKDAWVSTKYVEKISE